MTLRRTPQRVSGQRRVTTILDAAESLFAEVGYDAVTTNAIAARAGIPIGSVYQYFADKTAIVTALAERYGADASAHYDGLITTVLANEGAHAIAERLTAPLLEFSTHHPAFVGLVVGAASHPALAAAAGTMEQGMEARFTAVLHAAAPTRSAEAAGLAGLIAWTSAKALLSRGLIAKVSDEYPLHLAIVAETQHLLALYIAHFRAGVG